MRPKAVSDQVRGVGLALPFLIRIQRQGKLCPTFVQKIVAWVRSVARLGLVPGLARTNVRDPWFGSILAGFWALSGLERFFGAHRDP
jgi:hypothetical protein